MQSKAKKRLRLPSIFYDPLVLLAAIVVLLIVTLFIVYPLFMILKSSVVNEAGRFTFSEYVTALNDRGFQTAFANTMKLGFVSATLSTIIGFLFSYVDACISSPFKKLYNAITILPIVSPPFVLSLSAILLLGKRGLITHSLFGMQNANIYGFGGLVLVQTMTFFPVAAMMFKGLIKNMDVSLEEASRNMGASRWKTFTSITLPLLGPGIANAFLLVFIESVTDYSNPMIIGGGYATLASQIYIQSIANYQIQFGTTIAVFLLLVTILIFMVQKLLLERKSYVTLTGKAPRERQMIKDKSLSIPLNAVCLFCCFTILLFYGFLIMGSFFRSWGVDYTLSLDNYNYVFSYSMKPLIDSTVIALLAAPISGVFGEVIAYLVERKHFFGKGYLEQASLFGLAVPGTVFGLGYILSFNQKPLLLTNTLIILVMVLAMTRLPVGVRSGIAALEQIDPNIEEAASNLGANSYKVFWSVTLPLIKTSFFSGLIFTFIRSITAISSVIFLVSANYNLITVRMMTYADQGQFGCAAACAVLMIIIVFVVVYLMESLLKRVGVSKKEILAKSNPISEGDF